MAAVHGIKEGEAPEGKYRVLVELGQGGTANVYLAVARGPGGFNKLVVLKALKRDLSNDPEFRNMFLNEARLAARLNHPNIVQTNEVAEDQGLPVIVMEYLEGQPLSNLLIRGRGGALTLAMHLRIIADALQGLHCAHELLDFDGTPLGVVHRDMTPHNVFVTFDGQVKVLDFGIAKLGASLVETQAGIIKGKLRYMPPEQISGDPVDRRADLYAVGVMLWEAAAGERLWKGQADAAIMNKVLNAEIPSPRSVNADVPEPLEKIVMKALAADREQRFATAAELEQELDQFIGTLGPPVTNRQIGKMVATLFEDVRTKTKQLVDSQLSKVASLTWAEYQASQLLANAPTMTFSNSTNSNTISDSGSMDVLSGATRRGRRLAWGLGAAIAIIAIMAWKIAARDEKDRRALEQATAPVPATQPETPEKTPAPDRVLIRMSAVPNDARLFFDEEQLPSNPFARTMAADGSHHFVRAEAAGYNTGSTGVVLDKDTDVVLTLERSKKSEPTPPKGGNARPAPARPNPPTTPPPPVNPPAPPAKPDCNPPYYVDAHGIKRYKAECM